MAVNLSTDARPKIELQLTPLHVQGLYAVARRAPLQKAGDPVEVAVDAVLQHLAEWADRFDNAGCCTTCGGNGFEADMTPCSDCLATGHTHSSFSPCPLQAAQVGEGWLDVHKRALVMREEAQQLLQMAQTDMRCRSRVKADGDSFARRCALDTGHKGACDPIGPETEESQA